MATIQHSDEGFIGRAIQRAVNEAVQAAVKEEMEKAAEAVKKRIAGEADRIALAVMSQYDLSRNGTDILVRVRKVE